MPEAYLNVPPAYVFIGAYRLIHDPQLWKPMWAKCSKAATRAVMFASGWAVLTWPIQRWFVSYFMGASASVSGMKGIYNTFARTADRMDDPLPFIIPLPSLTTFAAMMFVAGQMQTIIEFFLRRQLKTFRAQAYQVTVQSRGKDTSWWGPYVEEWEEPPYAKAEKSGKKAKLYIRLASPIVTRFVLRIVLLPLDFVPFLSLATGAYVRSLAYGRQLLTPFFASKRMTPMQVELFMTERQASLRLYGFSCALMERFPLIGIVFSISNRVGAAMLAHDLEKRQHSFASGERKKLKKEETYNLGEIKGWKDLAEDDFAMPGAVFSAGSGQARQRPVPSVPTSGTGSATSHAASSQHVFPDAPPAYTEQDAMQALGEHS